MNTKEYTRRKIRQRRRTTMALVSTYKVKRGCEICGYNKCAEALDFHHEGDDKVGNISHMAGHGYAISRILEEMKKCIVICANCHRELHAEEKKLK